ncbi:ATP-binding protein [Hydrogenimonas urashimensis]|uniref:ATP-binding protein n=1 Tax=Hydrogenimonas urashimensis TaxID=2740515 RepID=UPI001915B081|nr:AAA family ATPase [Hydrogenimonas urashimensis]
MEVFESLRKVSYHKLKQKLPEYRRFLYRNILESDSRIVGIYGARGVGKTTLMLQVAQTLDYAPDELLYLSCDHPLFTEVSLYAFVEYFYEHGGKCILIDEIHEAKNFEREMKAVYDFLKIKVIFSGSSAVKITNASFARRYAMFHLPALSLREYMEMALKMSFDAYPLEKILQKHTVIADAVNRELGERKILKLYRDYLDHGAYPYYFDDPESYYQKMVDSINTALYTDIALLYGVPAEKVTLLKKLLLTICVSKPLELSIEKLSKRVGVSKATLYKYIDYLHRAELLKHITHEAKRFKSMQKPDKLYLAHPNLFNALCKQSDIGTLRETFFAFSLSYGHSIHYLDRGDFLIDENITFEIGGRNKSFEQIKEVHNAFVAADDIEIGFKNRIPLWLFGFLY